MQRKKLEKLQKHLRTLKLFKVKRSNQFFMVLPKSNDKTRFAMHNWEFDCGAPACVAGHAKYIFGLNWVRSWDDQFKVFFNLSWRESDWIIDYGSYKSLNPTPEIAAKHIQDVLDGKI